MNSVFSKDNLPRIKDGACVINFDDIQRKRVHWVSLFIDINAAVYFDSFEIEYIPREVSSKIKNKSITQNIFRIQSDYSIVCRFYCITFIECMIA